MSTETSLNALEAMATLKSSDVPPSRQQITTVLGNIDHYFSAYKTKFGDVPYGLLLRRMIQHPAFAGLLPPATMLPDQEVREVHWLKFKQRALEIVESLQTNQMSEDVSRMSALWRCLHDPNTIMGHEEAADSFISRLTDPLTDAYIKSVDLTSFWRVMIRSTQGRPKIFWSLTPKLCWHRSKMRL
jgi:hypothetical protein